MLSLLSCIPFVAQASLDAVRLDDWQRKDFHEVNPFIMAYLLLPWVLLLHPEAIKEEMETDPEESNSRVAKKRMLDQIVIIPATLYFPTSIVVELNEICEILGYTPEQLVIQALKGQTDYWNEFYEHVMTLLEKPGDFIWPEDAVFCLACVTLVHIITTFTRCSYDPVAFAHLKEHAPTEWSFSSLDEQEEIDDADWWKTPS